MTSTADMTQHPDVSEISDLHEGLLPPSRTADVRRHLDGCDLCADVHASLTEIRELLGTLPGPPRMPADVAGRIDAALAAEALLDATAPPQTATPVGATAVSVTTEASLGTESADAAAHVSRETSLGSTPADAPAADRPAGRPRAATGPGRSRTPRRRRTAVLGAVFGAAAIGVSVFLVQTLQTSDDTNAGKSDVTSRQQPGAVFSDSSLAGQVKSLLSSRPMLESSGTSPSGKGPDVGITSNSPNSPKLAAGVDVPPCVQAGTGRDSETPLAAETGEYQGTRAYLVVLPHPTDRSQVQAYVVDAACESAAPHGKGKLLLTHAYPVR
ncbi:anti-sigma factor family protein [Streptomyces noboritoensis]|uniref:Anti-sigma factor family protein n=1 Tax=Streptomyces noboritoensis TaxID=67337 RepID=A0ABV6TNE4_9ACTN